MQKKTKQFLGHKSLKESITIQELCFPNNVLTNEMLPYCVVDIPFRVQFAMNIGVVLETGLWLGDILRS